MTDFLILHMESNGLAPERGGRVFELALVHVQAGKILQTQTQLMNPGLPLPPFLTTLTGITPSMIREALSAAAAMPALAAFAGAGTLVAHNASLERKLWQNELALAGLAPAPEFLCTLRLARRLYPWANHQKTVVLATQLGIAHSNLHKRALDMALLKAQIFIRMQQDLARLYPDEVINTAFLQRYQNTGKALSRSVAAPF